MTATTRVMIDAQGGPEVMRLVEADLPPPGPGEVQLDQAAIGLNYMDVYQRSGLYKLDLPSPLGLEAAGTVTAIGAGVEGLAEGDRVAYGGVLGAYAGRRNAPAARMVAVPDGVQLEIAAAALMKGMTVEYLLERCFKVQPGQKVLFWAASGGVGQLAGQWGAHLGAEMIGVTSGAENCDRARAQGYAHAIDRTSEDVAARVREITGGEGVPVVYDAVGKASFDASIASLGVYGMFVSFGATTGTGARRLARSAAEGRVALLHAADAGELRRAARRPGTFRRAGLRDGLGRPPGGEPSASAARWPRWPTRTARSRPAPPPARRSSCPDGCGAR